MATIPDLRKRVWTVVNQCIDSVNNLNSVIYEDSINMPDQIEKKPEDSSNISLQYIQDGIDLYNSYKNEIEKKVTYLQSILDKNKECMVAVNQLVG